MKLSAISHRAAGGFLDKGTVWTETSTKSETELDKCMGTMGRTLIVKGKSLCKGATWNVNINFESRLMGIWFSSWTEPGVKGYGSKIKMVKNREIVKGICQFVAIQLSFLDKI